MNYDAIAVSVTDLNLYIKEKIAGDEALNAVVVKGEISNFKNHYFHSIFWFKVNPICITFEHYTFNQRFFIF